MPSTAGHPFNQSTADIVITSSDDVSFRLHRIILSLASDFFNDMLSLPQPNQRADETDTIPTILVSESSEVLEKLFRLCYPVDDPPMKTIEEVRSVLEAAMKYQMSEAVKITKRKLLALASTDPMRVYCVACQFSLEEEASAAAKEVYRQKAQDRYVEDLEETSIGAYHRLLSFCERDGRVRGERFKFTVYRNGRDDATVPPTPTPSIAQLTVEPPDPSVDGRLAPFPFDLAEAEIGLVTSDGVEFRVLQPILALCSPVLSTRVKELSPSAPATINVSEHSRIFSILLQLSYPTAEPRLEDLLDISAALVAAEKYEMQRAAQVLRAALASRRDSASEDPTTLYAIACRFGMRELAVAAARRTLRTEIMRAAASVSDLDALGVSAGCFYRLLDYHRRCRAAVRSIFSFDNSGRWIEYEMSAQLQACCRATFGLPCWFNPYMQRVGAEEWPKSASATDLALLQSVLEATRESGYPCGYCLDAQGVFLLICFSKYVAETMDSLETNVALKWVGSGPSPSPVVGR